MAVSYRNNEARKHFKTAKNNGGGGVSAASELSSTWATEKRGPNERTSCLHFDANNSPPVPNAMVFPHEAQMLLDRLNKHQELTRAFHRDLLADNKAIVEAQNQVRSVSHSNKYIPLKTLPTFYIQYFARNTKVRRDRTKGTGVRPVEQNC